MTTILERFGFLAVIAALAAGAVGCGSSDGGTSETPLTKAQFVAAGNKICEKRLAEKDATVKAALKEVASQGDEDASPQLIEEVGKSILSTYQDLADELGGLVPPAKGKADANKIIVEIEAGLKKAGANPASVARENYFQQAADAARAYGLTTCNL